MILLLIKLYLSIALTLFIPGWFLMKLILRKNITKISALEKITTAFALSIGSTNLVIILVNFFEYKITSNSIIWSLGIFSFTCWIIYKAVLKNKILFLSRKLKEKQEADYGFKVLSNNSYRQIFLFLIILLLSVIIRSLYIADGIIPQTTDLGHHMYWSKYIVENGTLPNYGMPDFIIGEHIIFAAVSLLSGIGFVSAMPVTILLIIQIFSLIATALLAYRIFSILLKKTTAKEIFILTLFILGTFYAISSPQAKFASGGVIGNVLGNFFIPFIFYALALVFKYKKTSFANLFTLCLATLAYCHHLSTFIFVFSFGAFILILFIATLLKFKTDLKRIGSLIYKNALPFFSVNNLLLILAIVGFAFFIHLPSYLNASAIDTAVGTPVKSTRTGYSINQIMNSVGAWRCFYAALGSVILTWIIFKIIRKKGKSFLKMTAALFPICWFGIVFIMSFSPELLKVDIPSRRIVSYLTFPATIISAFFMVFFIKKIDMKTNQSLAILVIITILGTGIVSGFSDISESSRKKDSDYFKKVMQTYLTAQYLNEVTDKSEMVLKDHIDLPGDTWMKLFFMRGYKYPLSRTFLRKYNDPFKQRETCTRDMIAIPDSEVANQCFNQTKTNYIVLKKDYDTAQFEKSTNFSKIYTSKDTVIFKRNSF